MFRAILRETDIGKQPFTLQKDMFCMPKVILLPSERIAFATQKDNFYPRFWLNS